MIIVEVKTQINGKYSLRFQIPDKGKTKFEYGMASSPAEAKRKLYFRTREYIYTRIHAWLIQRKHAIAPYPSIPDYSEKLATIELLLAKLEHAQNWALWALCDQIAANREKLIHLAPSENSRVFSHYSKTISPIIKFCTDNQAS